MSFRKKKELVYGWNTLNVFTFIKYRKDGCDLACKDISLFKYPPIFDSYNR